MALTFFPMKMIPSVVVLTLGAMTLAGAMRAAEKLPRSTPEAQGVSSAAILKFVEEAGAKVNAIHSFMLVRHGHVVAEGWWTPYAAEEQHVLFSLSKSFTSTAVGLAIAEGKLSVDDPVLKFFPEDAPAEPSKNLQAMRVRDLLTMNTGQHAEVIDGFPFGSSENLVKRFLSLPVAHKPGTHFVYNTPATYMLSAIVQKVTGQTTLDYLRPRLFEPLGIEQPRWDASAQGISLGGFGLNVRTEDIAKFGQLYLQRGEWHGKQLVPAAWIDTATARQVSNGSDPSSDWEQGYGYQFWRCRHGFYRGDGAFGQFCIVIPQEDTVIAITSGTKDMGLVMNLLWDHILPALKPAPLPADAAAQQQLTARLASLSLPTVSGAPQPAAAKRADIVGVRYGFPANPQQVEAITIVAVEPSGRQEMRVRMAGEDQDFAVPLGSWEKTAMPEALGGEPVALSGAWTADDTYALQVVRYRTPFATTYRLRFANGELTLDAEQNVGFGPTQAPAVVGKRD